MKFSCSGKGNKVIKNKVKVNINDKYKNSASAGVNSKI